MMQIILFFISFLFLMAQGSPAGAFSLDLEKIKPLTEIEFPPAEEFNAATKMIKVAPYEDEFLSYSLRLPKDWGENVAPPVSKSEAAGAMSQRVLGLVAKYYSPPKDYLRSFFTIEALELNYEIDARNWFINYVISNGLSLEQVSSKTGRVVEAIHIEVQGDTTFVVRSKAMINGARIIMGKYYVPQDHYNDDRVLQAQIIKSFQLENIEEAGVEKLKIHGFLDQSFFDYPESWTLNAPHVRSIERMRAMLFHSTMVGKLDGQINLYLTNKMTESTRAKEIAYYRDNFAIQNYKLGEYLETPTLTYHKDMTFGRTEIYKMEPQVKTMLDYELWVSVMEGEEYIYIATLITPARTAEFYTWARNVKAYAIVVKGIRRHDDNVNYFEFIKFD